MPETCGRISTVLEASSWAGYSWVNEVGRARMVRVDTCTGCEPVGALWPQPAASTSSIQIPRVRQGRAGDAAALPGAEGLKCCTESPALPDEESESTRR